MEHDILSQELSDCKPTASSLSLSSSSAAAAAGGLASEDGAWEMTQLAIESAIGDLQRGQTG